jgi:hypothetical protein
MSTFCNKFNLEKRSTEDRLIQLAAFERSRQNSICRHLWALFKQFVCVEIFPDDLKIADYENSANGNKAVRNQRLRKTDVYANIGERYTKRPQGFVAGVLKAFGKPEISLNQTALRGVTTERRPIVISEILASTSARPTQHAGVGRPSRSAR